MARSIEGTKDERLSSALELIDSFEKHHKAFLKHAEAMQAGGCSTKDLRAVAVLRQAADDACECIYREGFFRNCGNEMVIEAAVNSVMAATEEVVDLIPVLDWSLEATEFDALREGILARLTTGQGEEVNNSSALLAKRYQKETQNLQDALYKKGGIIAAAVARSLTVIMARKKQHKQT